MTNEASPTAPPKPWIWLVVAGVLSAVSDRVAVVDDRAAGVHPHLPCAARVRTVIPNWLPFVSIGIIAAIFVAMIVVYLLRKPTPARLLVLLTIAISVVTLLTALVMLLAGARRVRPVPAAGDRRLAA